MPPHQHSAATTAALRGPARSSHPPHNAAEDPSSTKNSVYIQPSVAMRQSQLTTKSSWKKLVPGGQASDSLMPSARESGNQNTEKA
jgi:hypothetical protein